jgi:hypothetical protein
MIANNLADGKETWRYSLTLGEQGSEWFGPFLTIRYSCFGSPWWSLLLPLRTMPYTDGWSWAKRPGMESHGGVPEGEEMTDDEES